MEVHHHPQVEKKRFKEYFLKFLMIFIAVTLGFFAESTREHITDKQREKKYLSSLLQELQYDTAHYHLALEKTEVIVPSLDSLFMNIKQIQHYKYVLLSKWNTAINEGSVTYKPALTTIEQLKNSGNLRLIEDQDIAKQIQVYENFVLGDLQNNYNEVNNAKYKVFGLEDAYCNYDDFNKKLSINIINAAKQTSTESSLLFDMPLYVKDPEKLNQLANSFVNYKAWIYGFMTSVNHAIQIATGLINLIQDKYHFK